jgi:dUTP pyrophosphatase
MDFKFAKCKPNAVAPTKAYSCDTGYDLTILDIVKDYGRTKLYGTGIKIEPPENIYFDIVPRSSISKTGYILANSVAVIDSSYRGELLIALTKIDNSKPDLTLPMRIAQLVPRNLLKLEPTEVIEDELTSTIRNTDGFGSTG